MPLSPNYYIICVSLDHCEIGVAEGFTQANHGKSSSLKLLNKGDKIVIYSSKYKLLSRKESLKENKLQAFTAVGEILDDTPYLVDVPSNLKPFRRKVSYIKNAKNTPIFPLIEKLKFIKDKDNWGLTLMTGFLKISQVDFETISKEMIKSV